MTATAKVFKNAQMTIKEKIVVVHQTKIIHKGLKNEKKGATE